MANVKISELPSLATVPGDAVVPVVSGGTTYRATKAAVTDPGDSWVVHGTVEVTGVDGTTVLLRVDEAEYTPVVFPKGWLCTDEAAELRLAIVDGNFRLATLAEDLEIYAATDLKLQGLVWPNTDGAAGQALRTDGSGNLSFGKLALTALADGTAQGQTPVWSGSAWTLKGIKSSSLTDADATIAWSTASRFVSTVTLTANRTTTLGTSGSPPTKGVEYVESYNSTAYTRAIVNGGPAGGTLYTCPANSNVSVAAAWNGTDWALSGVIQLS